MFDDRGNVEGACEGTATTAGDDDWGPDCCTDWCPEECTDCAEGVVVDDVDDDVVVVAAECTADAVLNLVYPSATDIKSDSEKVTSDFTVIWLVVRVPVLSVQMTEVQPKVSTEGSLRTMTFLLAMRLSGDDGGGGDDDSVGGISGGSGW